MTSHGNRSCHMPWPVLAALSTFLAACSDPPVAPNPLPMFDVIGGEEVTQVFIVTNTADGGPGSLRQAILDANAAAGLDGIAFEIPGPGPHSIQPLSPLPAVTDPLVMDGYTQPGAGPNTNPVGSGSNAVLKIELDGSAAGAPGPGLVLAGGGSTVRGLAINGFQDGIVLTSGGNRVRGSRLGTDVSGASAAPNLGNGVVILDADNLVGGSAPGDRNLISGNLNDGVLVVGPGAVRNQIAGNYIGLDASGTLAIPNNLPEPAPVNSAAVHVTAGASHNLIGGDGARAEACDGACNVISGNNRTAVWIEGGASRNTVEGNRIGTTADGAGPLGNNRWGVFLGGTGSSANRNVLVGNHILWSGRDGVGLLSGSSQNTIGGSHVTPGACDGACNRIAFNGQRFDTQGDGVRLFGSAGVGNAILGNSISSNPLGLGIDLGPGGVTFNDFGDFDVGPNNLQNFPVIASASGTPRHLVVRGSVDTPDPRQVLIELFANAVPDPGADPSGFGEGAVFLGRAAPDAEGDFVARLAAVPHGTLISATATSADGSTSEFAANVEVVPPRGPPAGHERFFPFSAFIGTCGEAVSVSGSFHPEFRFTSDGAGGFHFVGHINAIGIGVGQTTGAIYLWNDVINQQGSFRGGQQTFTNVQSFELIGRGGAPNLRLRARFHVTVTPQGVVNITVDDFSVDCG